jgi:hypothetical protein
LYLGGGVGAATINSEDEILGEELDFDESDTAYRIYGGFMFLEILGLEVSYIDFGKPEDDFNFGGPRFDVDAEATGYTAEVLGVLPLGPVEFFAKAGYMSYDVDVNVSVQGFGNFSDGEDGEGGLVGGGAMLDIGPVALRAEATMYDVDNVDDVYTFLIGAQIEL